MPGASFVELLNTSTNLSFDLSNWRLNGLDYTFPSGTLLTNRQLLVLVKDRNAFATEFGLGICPFDVFAGNLQINGETLTLLMPIPQTNLFTTIDQVRYGASPPWPATAPGVSLQVIDPRQGQQPRRRLGGGRRHARRHQLGQRDAALFRPALDQRASGREPDEPHQPRRRGAPRGSSFTMPGPTPSCSPTCF